MNLRALYTNVSLIFILIAIVIVSISFIVNSSLVSIHTSVLPSPSESLYDYYAGLERPYTIDYSLYILNPYDDEYISEVASRMSYEEIVKLSNIEYKRDIESQGIEEYPQYPVETLHLGTGDCEDIAILQCALLRSLGYETVLIRTDNHMSAGTKLNGEWTPLRKDELRYNGNMIYHEVIDKSIITINGKYSSHVFYINVTNYGNIRTDDCILDVSGIYMSDPFVLYPLETRNFQVYNLFRESPSSINIYSNDKLIESIYVTN